MRAQPVILLLVLAAVVVCGAGWRGAAVAQEGGGLDPKAPVDVQSDTLDIDPVARQATFAGHVEIKHPELHLKCERLVATVDEAGQPLVLRAEGDVRVAWRDVVARAGGATWDRSGGHLTLTGAPKLWRSGSRVEGEQVRIDLKTRAIRVEKPRGTLAAWGAAAAAPTPEATP